MADTFQISKSSPLQSIHGIGRVPIGGQGYEDLLAKWRRIADEEICRGRVRLYQHTLWHVYRAGAVAIDTIPHASAELWGKPADEAFVVFSTNNSGSRGAVEVMSSAFIDGGVSNINTNANNTLGPSALSFKKKRLGMNIAAFCRMLADCGLLSSAEAFAGKVIEHSQSPQVAGMSREPIDAADLNSPSSDESDEERGRSKKPLRGAVGVMRERSSLALAAKLSFSDDGSGSMMEKSLHQQRGVKNDNKETNGGEEETEKGNEERPSPVAAERSPPNLLGAIESSRVSSLGAAMKQLGAFDEVKESEILDQSAKIGKNVENKHSDHDDDEELDREKNALVGGDGKSQTKRFVSTLLTKGKALTRRYLASTHAVHTMLNSLMAADLDPRTIAAVFTPITASMAEELFLFATRGSESATYDDFIVMMTLLGTYLESETWSLKSTADAVEIMCRKHFTNYVAVSCPLTIFDAVSVARGSAKASDAIASAIRDQEAREMGMEIEHGTHNTSQQRKEDSPIDTYDDRDKKERGRRELSSQATNSLLSNSDAISPFRIFPGVDEIFFKYLDPIAVLMNCYEIAATRIKEAIENEAEGGTGIGIGGPEDGISYLSSTLTLDHVEVRHLMRDTAKMYMENLIARKLKRSREQHLLTTVTASKSSSTPTNHHRRTQAGTTPSTQSLHLLESSPPLSLGATAVTNNSEALTDRLAGLTGVSIRVSSLLGMVRHALAYALPDDECFPSTRFKLSQPSYSTSTLFANNLTAETSSPILDEDEEAEFAAYKRKFLGGSSSGTTKNGTAFTGGTYSSSSSSSSPSLSKTNERTRHPCEGPRTLLELYNLSPETADAIVKEALEAVIGTKVTARMKKMQQSIRTKETSASTRQFGGASFNNGNSNNSGSSSRYNYDKTTFMYAIPPATGELESENITHTVAPVAQTTTAALGIGAKKGGNAIKNEKRHFAGDKNDNAVFVVTATASNGRPLMPSEVREANLMSYQLSPLEVSDVLCLFAIRAYGGPSTSSSSSSPPINDTATSTTEMHLLHLNLASTTHATNADLPTPCARYQALLWDLSSFFSAIVSGAGGSTKTKGQDDLRQGGSYDMYKSNTTNNSRSSVSVAATGLGAFAGVKMSALVEASAPHRPIIVNFTPKAAPLFTEISLNREKFRPAVAPLLVGGGDDPNVLLPGHLRGLLFARGTEEGGSGKRNNSLLQSGVGVVGGGLGSISSSSSPPPLMITIYGQHFPSSGLLVRYESHVKAADGVGIIRTNAITQPSSRLYVCPDGRGPFVCSSIPMLGRDKQQFTIRLRRDVSDLLEEVEGTQLSMMLSTSSGSGASWAKKNNSKSMMKNVEGSRRKSGRSERIRFVDGDGEVSNGSKNNASTSIHVFKDGGRDRNGSDRNRGLSSSLKIEDDSVAAVVCFQREVFISVSSDGGHKFYPYATLRSAGGGSTAGGGAPSSSATATLSSPSQLSTTSDLRGEPLVLESPAEGIILTPAHLGRLQILFDHYKEKHNQTAVSSRGGGEMGNGTDKGADQTAMPLDTSALLPLKSWARFVIDFGLVEMSTLRKKPSPFVASDDEKQQDDKATKRQGKQSEEEEEEEDSEGRRKSSLSPSSALPSSPTRRGDFVIGHDILSAPLVRVPFEKYALDRTTFKKGNKTTATDKNVTEETETEEDTTISALSSSAAALPFNGFIRAIIDLLVRTNTPLRVGLQQFLDGHEWLRMQENLLERHKAAAMKRSIAIRSEVRPTTETYATSGLSTSLAISSIGTNKTQEDQQEALLLMSASKPLRDIRTLNLAIRRAAKLLPLDRRESEIKENAKVSARVRHSLKKLESRQRKPTTTSEKNGRDGFKNDPSGLIHSSDDSENEEGLRTESDEDEATSTDEDEEITKKRKGTANEGEESSELLLLIPCPSPRVAGRHPLVEMRPLDLEDYIALWDDPTPNTADRGNEDQEGLEKRGRGAVEDEGDKWLRAAMVITGHNTTNNSYQQTVTSSPTTSTAKTPLQPLPSSIGGTTTTGQKNVRRYPRGQWTNDWSHGAMIGEFMKSTVLGGGLSSKTHQKVAGGSHDEGKTPSQTTETDLLERDGPPLYFDSHGGQFAGEPALTPQQLEAERKVVLMLLGRAPTDATQLQRVTSLARIRAMSASRMSLGYNNTASRTSFVHQTALVEEEEASVSKSKLKAKRGIPNSVNTKPISTAKAAPATTSSLRKTPITHLLESEDDDDEENHLEEQIANSSDEKNQKSKRTKENASQYPSPQIQRSSPPLDAKAKQVEALKDVMAKARLQELIRTQRAAATREGRDKRRIDRLVEENERLQKALLTSASEEKSPKRETAGGDNYGNLNNINVTRKMSSDNTNIKNNKNNTASDLVAVPLPKPIQEFGGGVGVLHSEKEQLTRLVIMELERRRAILTQELLTAEESREKERKKVVEQLRSSVEESEKVIEELRSVIKRQQEHTLKQGQVVQTLAVQTAAAKAHDDFYKNLCESLVDKFRNGEFSNAGKRMSLSSVNHQKEKDEDESEGKALLKSSSAVERTISVNSRSSGTSTQSRRKNAAGPSPLSTPSRRAGGGLLGGILSAAGKKSNNHATKSSNSHLNDTLNGIESVELYAKRMQTLSLRHDKAFSEVLVEIFTNDLVVNNSLLQHQPQQHLRHGGPSTPSSNKMRLLTPSQSPSQLSLGGGMNESMTLSTATSTPRYQQSRQQPRHQTPRGAGHGVLPFSAPISVNLLPSIIADRVKARMGELAQRGGSSSQKVSTSTQTAVLLKNIDDDDGEKKTKEKLSAGLGGERSAGEKQTASSPQHGGLMPTSSEVSAHLASGRGKMTAAANADTARIEIGVNTDDLPFFVDDNLPSTLPLLLADKEENKHQYGSNLSNYFARHSDEDNGDDDNNNNNANRTEGIKGSKTIAAVVGNTTKWLIFNPKIRIPPPKRRKEVRIEWPEGETLDENGIGHTYAIVHDVYLSSSSSSLSSSASAASDDPKSKKQSNQRGNTSQQTGGGRGPEEKMKTQSTKKHRYHHDHGEYSHQDYSPRSPYGMVRSEEAISGRIRRRSHAVGGPPDMTYVPPHRQRAFSSVRRGTCSEEKRGIESKTKKSGVRGRAGSLAASHTSSASTGALPSQQQHHQKSKEKTKYAQREKSNSMSKMGKKKNLRTDTEMTELRRSDDDDFEEDEFEADLTETSSSSALSSSNEVAENECGTLFASGHTTAGPPPSRAESTTTTTTTTTTRDKKSKASRSPPPPSSQYSHGFYIDEIPRDKLREMELKRLDGGDEEEAGEEEEGFETDNSNKKKTDAYVHGGYTPPSTHARNYNSNPPRMSRRASLQAHAASVGHPSSLASTPTSLHLHHHSRGGGGGKASGGEGATTVVVNKLYVPIDEDNLILETERILVEQQVRQKRRLSNSSSSSQQIKNEKDERNEDGDKGVDGTRGEHERGSRSPSASSDSTNSSSENSVDEEEGDDDMALTAFSMKNYLSLVNSGRYDFITHAVKPYDTLSNLLAIYNPCALRKNILVANFLRDSEAAAQHTAKATAPHSATISTNEEDLCTDGQKKEEEEEQREDDDKAVNFMIQGIPSKQLRIPIPKHLSTAHAVQASAVNELLWLECQRIQAVSLILNEAKRENKGDKSGNKDEQISCALSGKETADNLLLSLESDVIKYHVRLPTYLIVDRWGHPARDQRGVAQQPSNPDHDPATLASNPLHPTSTAVFTTPLSSCSPDPKKNSSKKQNNTKLIKRSKQEKGEVGGNKKIKRKVVAGDPTYKAEPKWIESDHSSSVTPSSALFSPEDPPSVLNPHLVLVESQQRKGGLLGDTKNLRQEGGEQVEYENAHGDFGGIPEMDMSMRFGHQNFGNDTSSSPSQHHHVGGSNNNNSKGSSATGGASNDTSPANGRTLTVTVHLERRMLPLRSISTDPTQRQSSDDDNNNNAITNIRYSIAYDELPDSSAEDVEHFIEERRSFLSTPPIADALARVSPFYLLLNKYTSRSDLSKVTKGTPLTLLGTQSTTAAAIRESPLVYPSTNQRVNNLIERLRRDRLADEKERERRLRPLLEEELGENRKNAQPAVIAEETYKGDFMPVSSANNNKGAPPTNKHHERDTKLEEGSIARPKTPAMVAHNNNYNNLNEAGMVDQIMAMLLAELDAKQKVKDVRRADRKRTQIEEKQHHHISESINSGRNGGRTKDVLSTTTTTTTTTVAANVVHPSEISQKKGSAAEESTNAAVAAATPNPTFSPAASLRNRRESVASNKIADRSISPVSSPSRHSFATPSALPSAAPTPLNLALPSHSIKNANNSFVNQSTVSLISVPSRRAEDTTFHASPEKFGDHDYQQQQQHTAVSKLEAELEKTKSLLQSEQEERDKANRIMADQTRELRIELDYLRSFVKKGALGAVDIASIMGELTASSSLSSPSTAAGLSTLPPRGDAAAFSHHVSKNARQINHFAEQAKDLPFSPSSNRSGTTVNILTNNNNSSGSENPPPNAEAVRPLFQKNPMPTTTTRSVATPTLLASVASSHQRNEKSGKAKTMELTLTMNTRALESKKEDGPEAGKKTMGGNDALVTGSNYGDGSADAASASSTHFPLLTIRPAPLIYLYEGLQYRAKAFVEWQEMEERVLIAEEARREFEKAYEALAFAKRKEKLSAYSGSIASGEQPREKRRTFGLGVSALSGLPGGGGVEVTTLRSALCRGERESEEDAAGDSTKNGTQRPHPAHFHPQLDMRKAALLLARSPSTTTTKGSKSPAATIAGSYTSAKQLFSPTQEQVRYSPTKLSSGRIYPYTSVNARPNLLAPIETKLSSRLRALTAGTTSSAPVATEHSSPSAPPRLAPIAHASPVAADSAPRKMSHASPHSSPSYSLQNESAADAARTLLHVEDRTRRDGMHFEQLTSSVLIHQSGAWKSTAEIAEAARVQRYTERLQAIANTNSADDCGANASLSSSGGGGAANSILRSGEGNPQPSAGGLGLNKSQSELVATLAALELKIRARPK